MPIIKKRMQLVAKIRKKERKKVLFKHLTDFLSFLNSKTDFIISHNPRITNDDLKTKEGILLFPTITKNKPTFVEKERKATNILS